MYNVLLVSLIGITVGFLAIGLGHAEIGATMCSATITGYFGYSRQNKNIANSKQTLLVLYVNVVVLVFLLKNIDKEIITRVMSLAMEAITGYLGFTQQNIKEDRNGF